MKSIFLLLSMLLSASATVFSATWTITNSGATFTPASLTINLGDEVDFDIASFHNAVEVSQATWNANGTTALPGFSLDMGGGLVSSAQLTVGTHYYVCQPHASSGMKGIIIVQNTTGVAPQPLSAGVSVFPNPVSDLLTIKSESNASDLGFVITGQTGKRVFAGSIGGGETLVDVSQLPNGIYLLQIGEQRKQTVKFVKK